jgi:signal transduction histidine kinase
MAHFRSFLIALALVTIEVAIRGALHPVLGDQYTTIFFIVAVVAASYIDGTRCAIYATVLSWLSVILFFVPPEHVILPIALHDFIGTLVLLISGLAIALISGRMSLLQRRAERSAAERQVEVDRLIAEVRLGERMATVGTLTAGITHDIANILLPMRARLQMLETRLSPAAIDADQHLQRVGLFADYLERLAQSLNGLVADPAASCDGRTALAQWRDAAAPILNAAVPRSVTVELTVPDDLPDVRIAEHALSQAVFNAVHNAGKALSAQTAGHIQVGAASDPSKETVRITIRDDGPGIPADVLASLRSAQPRLDAEGRVSGMGLRLIRSIVEAVDGAVEIVSEPGHGTTVTIVVPAAAPPRLRSVPPASAA